MHFLFCSVGSAGDVLPLLSIAQELRARGHRATLAACHGYGSVTDATGVTYAPLTSYSEQQEAIRDKMILPTRYGGLYLYRHSVKWNESLLKLMEEHSAEDLVVVSSNRPNLWADLTASNHFGVNVVRTMIDLPLNPEIARHAIPAGRIQSFLEARWKLRWEKCMAERGLNAGPDHVYRTQKSARRWVPEVALWPHWAVDRSHLVGLSGAFGFMPAPIFPPNCRPEHLDRRASERTSNGKLVFVAGTEGTTRMWLDSFTEVCADVCRELECTGTLVGGTGAQNESRIANGLKSVGFTPLRELLKSASAIIHHGGIGTAAAALERGIPQVVIPRVFMQPSNAEWLRRLGVCTVVTQRAWTANNAARYVREALSDHGMKARAEGIAKRINRSAALNAVCRFLEEPSNYMRPGHRSGEHADREEVTATSVAE